MSTELRITFNAPTADLDPSSALGDIRSLLSMLGEMESTIARRDEVQLTAWRFSRLRLGSVDAAFRPQGDIDEERPRQASLRLVRGFADAEQSEGIPGPWSLKAVRKAQDITGRLGDSEEAGLTLRLVVDGEQTATALVTARAARHLRAARRPSQESIGSVVGELGSMSGRGGRLVAGIWPERGGRRVRVTFSADQLDLVRQALTEPRVQVAGRLYRNSQGQLLRVQMRTLDVLPATPDPSKTQLRGLAPDITGGLSPAEHVRRLRAGP